MANKYSLIISSKDTSGKDLSKTVSDINPDAQPSVLKAMAQGLNGLTTNVYQSADRVARENVDTATDKAARNPIIDYKDNANGGANIPFDLTQSSYELPLSVLDSSNKFMVRYVNDPALPDDTARIFLHNASSTAVSIPTNISGQEYATHYSVNFTFNLSAAVQTLTFTISVASTPTHQAWEKTFVINFIQGGE